MTRAALSEPNNWKSRNELVHKLISKADRAGFPVISPGEWSFYQIFLFPRKIPFFSNWYVEFSLLFATEIDRIKNDDIYIENPAKIDL